MYHSLFSWQKAIICLVVCVISPFVNAAPKVIIGDNVSGWDTSYTQTPFDASGTNYTPQALSWIKQLSPGGGVIRAMDMMQTVGSKQALFSDRSASNINVNGSGKGVTWESLWQLGNLTHNRLWVNIPQPTAQYLNIADQNSVKASYAYQMGLSAGKNVDSRLGYIKVEFSNELWNGGDQNQGTANLFRARASSTVTPGASDFQKMSEQAWIDWYDGVKAFKQGVKDSGSTLEVRGQAPGFIANNYFAQYGATRLQQVRGSDSDYNTIMSKSRIIIAPYAPGSPSDIGNIQPNDTHQAIIDRTKVFVNNNYPGWFSSNKSVSNFFGMAGLDAYETMGLSTYDFTSGTNLLVDLNRTSPLAKQYETDFFTMVADMLDGALDGKSDPNATLIIFGSAGIPYSENFGQWSPKEFYDSAISPKGQGILDFIGTSSGNVDPIAVPEPSTIGLALICMCGLLIRRR